MTKKSKMNRRDFLKMGGIAGVAPAAVVILGAGVVGFHAARVATRRHCI